MPDWPVLSRYDADHLREIAMPLGGIGTGFFALGGRGQLTDWQLMSRPNRGWRPMYCHLLLTTRGKSVKEGSAPAQLRALEGDLTDGLAADSGAPQVLAGLPRFRNARFEAAYPFGAVHLSDPDTPVTVVVEGFNPLIPNDTDASSLPLGLLTVSLTNTTREPLRASLTFLLTNFIGGDGITWDLKDNVSERLTVGAWKGLRFDKLTEAKTAQNGTMTLLCDGADVTVARRWPFRDRPWGGEALGIMDHLLADGFLPDDDPDSPCPPSPQDTWDSSVSAGLDLAARETKQVRFLLTWHFPYRNMAQDGWWQGKEGDDPALLNHYATRFTDATDVAAQVTPRLDELRRRSIAFVNSVTDRKAPHALKEAALFNLTSLRSHTCFRIGDGTFLGFEGCNGTTGCCHGSCTHVWNYEEATVSLFPDLHRSMLESHLSHGVTDTGGERFRLSLPMVVNDWGGAAADGQMGLIVRVYEQYLADKATGGLNWLKRQFPIVKRMMQFAWEPGGWDADKDGVMEGSQHNTYDVEFFGPNPLCTVWYLAALRATEEMARLAGDDAFAEECAGLRRRGAEWVDSHLYNGRYYVQKELPPPAHPAPLTALTGEAASKAPRFQVGDGCIIDQLVGQYKANRAGLGDLLDGLHLRTAARSVYANNYRRDFRDHYNNMRTFATAGERGTLICSYPEGGRPAQPFPYWSECMTGFEYALAVLLLDYGYNKEATDVVEAVRDRHNGANRNPFNEPECGSYYARAMASWALLDAWK